MASFKDLEKNQRMRTDDNVIVPFAGHPGANVRALAPGCTYGLQPDATPLMAELAATIQATLDNCQPHARAAAAKASLRGYLCEDQLIATTHRQGDTHKYRRHLLYADPHGQFSILAIVWRPGQHTPIHGHTAWGVVGVYAGNPYCEVFDMHTRSRPAINLDPLMKLRLKPGDLSTVQPGIDDVHRIGNDGLSRCITIHVYGRDLLVSPHSINIIFNS